MLLRTKNSRLQPSLVIFAELNNIFRGVHVVSSSRCKNNQKPSNKHDATQQAVKQTHSKPSDPKTQPSSYQNTFDATAIPHTFAITTVSFVRLSTDSLAGECVAMDKTSASVHHQCCKNDPKQPKWLSAFPLNDIASNSITIVMRNCQVIYSQFGLAIHQNDHQARRRFVEWAQNEIAVVPDFHKRILFSDEAHFWLNGYVNKQNCRIWSEANPQVYVETPLQPEKLTVWCALWAGGIIGPYFFKSDEGHNELWFQQDGATCHTARATIDLLKDTFGDRLISRFGPVNWPPRSCDLTPQDYFLWGYVMSLVYANKPQTLDHLEDNIRRVTADIWPQML
ncbi:putative transposable element [Trichonephila clavipes]|nr:putative transposable element [Trichonephila clavipes]